MTITSATNRTTPLVTRFTTVVGQSVMVLALMAQVSTPVAATTFSTEYERVNSVAIHCQVEKPETFAPPLTREQICEAARSALMRLADGKFGEAVTRHAAWSKALDPAWIDECTRALRTSIAAGCNQAAHQILDSGVRVPVELVTRVNRELFTNPNQLVVWFRVRTTEAPFCVGDRQAILVAWRAIYELDRFIQTHPLGFGIEFAHRMKPRFPEIICIERSDAGIVRLVDDVMGMYASWFSPYLINVMNANAERRSR